MNWYLAKMVFRIICGDGKHTAQFDEQLRLFEAPDETTAFEKALETGKLEEDRFLNEEEQLVQWKFVNISALYRISQLIDGAELYSKIIETDNADHFMHATHKKAMHIQDNISRQLLELY